jgi:hypothetical protein
VKTDLLTRKGWVKKETAIRIQATMTNDYWQTVSFRHVSEFPGWAAAPVFFSTIIATRHPRLILEVGSGANPTLSLSQIPQGTEYVTSDVDVDELEKAGSGYTARLLDLERGEPPADLLDKCDLVFSRMVNEHVRDGRAYHGNVFKLLAPGGVAVHCFATLYALPFVLNRILPDSLSATLLSHFMPRDGDKHGKFRAYYGWSRGPTKEMIRQFQKLGYEVVRYDGYFGHYYYRRRMKPLDRLEHAKARLLLKVPIPLLCSFATVVLRKPSGDAGYSS